MALSSASTSSVLPRAPPSVLTLLHPHSSSSTLPFLFPFSTSITPTALGLSTTPHSLKWRTSVSFFPTFLGKPRDANSLKEELLGVIGPLDRGADASPEDQRTVDQELTMRRMIGSAKEKDGPYYFDDGPSSSRQCQINPVKEPLKSNLLDGKWELIYTTSKSILQTEVTADLTPLNSRKVAVKFDYFKIAGVIPIKAPGRARGELEITYLDEELRISRGDKGNLFILKMIDPSYRVPV
ncbi:probable plastid-lipid-associated protein 4, chloroplastic isoform X3 [Malania oleifera]|uniref:probable plastid-lipid-associated protein 4, chloroplastic isoform X3 n=1 Tax=Malania oleifera TaxID=397392 RepID=UPI0025AE4D1E|nr:probable plastid-lipid-associated protein 4, chloroplastic isoform X3 [Malania oleifera]